MLDCPNRRTRYTGTSRRLEQTKHFTYDSKGYLVGYEATELAIKKCKQVGVAVVGASGTYYTGMLSYYAEMAAAEDLVTVIASHCTGKSNPPCRQIQAAALQRWKC
jgi:hypothetical protein